jgi:hypothetical protein
VPDDDEEAEDEEEELFGADEIEQIAARGASKRGGTGAAAPSRHPDDSDEEAAGDDGYDSSSLQDEDEDEDEDRRSKHRRGRKKLGRGSRTPRTSSSLSAAAGSGAKARRSRLDEHSDEGSGEDEVDYAEDGEGRRQGKGLALDRHTKMSVMQRQQRRAGGSVGSAFGAGSTLESSLQALEEIEQLEEEGGKAAPAATYADYLKLQVRRAFLDQSMDEPFFDKAVAGCFVRVFVGNRHGVAVYRMCEVLDVVPYKREYEMPVDASASGPARRGRMVSKALNVTIGSSPSVVKMSLVSNSRISETEFAFYVRSLETDRKGPIPLLTVNVSIVRQSSLNVIMHV